MNNLVNYFTSRIGYGNTGQPKGKQFTLKPFKGVLIHPDGFTIPNEVLSGTYESLVAHLQAAQLNAPERRVWCFPSFAGVTDTSEAADVQKTPYGFNVVRSEKPQTMDIELENLGTEYYKGIRNFTDRTDLRAIFFQEDGILLEDAGNGEAQGCEISLIANQTTIPTIDAYQKQILAVQIKDSGFLSDRVNFVQTKTGKEFISFFKGILNVEHSEPATNVVKAVEAISKTDLYDVYDTELAVPAAWWIRNLLTGGLTRPTTVVINPVNKGWAITTAVSAPREIFLDTPTALATLGVGSITSGGFESIPFRLGE